MVSQKRAVGLGSQKTSSCLKLYSPVLSNENAGEFFYFMYESSANKDAFFDKPGSSLLLFPIVICYHNMEENYKLTYY